MAWLAPEAYINLKLMTVSRDRFALGTTLWEIFAQGKRPFANIEPKEVGWELFECASISELGLISVFFYFCVFIPLCNNIL